MAARSPHAVLGLAPSAGPEEARAAFRAIAKDCHPDLRPGDAAARARFEEAQDAYARVVTANRPTPRFTTPQPPAAAALTLSLEEAARGATKRIVARGQAVFVTAPAGSRAGDRLRAKTADGGLIAIEVRLSSHPRFEAKGSDLFGFFDLTAEELRGRLTLSAVTPAATVQFRPPVGATFGAQVRLRGKGLPGRGATPPGDLYLELREAPATGAGLKAAVAAFAQRLGLRGDALRAT